MLFNETAINLSSRHIKVYSVMPSQNVMLFHNFFFVLRIL